MGFRESSHKESCIVFADVGCEGEDHFGVPRVVYTRDGSYGHSCDCLCHGIYWPFEERIEGEVIRLDDEVWRLKNR